MVQISLAKKILQSQNLKAKQIPTFYFVNFFVGQCTVLTTKVQMRSRIQGSGELLDLWKPVMYKVLC